MACIALPIIPSPVRPIVATVHRAGRGSHAIRRDHVQSRVGAPNHISPACPLRFLMLSPRDGRSLSCSTHSPTPCFRPACRADPPSLFPCRPDSVIVHAAANALTTRPGLPPALPSRCRCRLVMARAGASPPAARVSGRDERRCRHRPRAWLADGRRAHIRRHISPPPCRRRHGLGAAAAGCSLDRRPNGLWRASVRPATPQWDV